MYLIGGFWLPKTLLQIAQIRPYMGIKYLIVFQEKKCSKFDKIELQKRNQRK